LWIFADAVRSGSTRCRADGPMAAENSRFIGYNLFLRRL